MPGEYKFGPEQEPQVAGPEGEKINRGRRLFLEQLAALVVTPAMAEAARKHSNKHNKGEHRDGKHHKPRIKNPELRGTAASMDRQNLIALAEDLSPITNYDQLDEFAEANPALLVRLPESHVIRVAKNLKADDRAYCRPWTAKFLKELGADFGRQFPKGHFTIQSSVRPRSLGKVNHNASPRSVHPVGNTIDILYNDLNPDEQAWMEKRLTHYEDLKFQAAIPPQQRMSKVQKSWYKKLTKREKNILSHAKHDKLGNAIITLPLVEATKEANQPCYHFSVAKHYLQHHQK
jgi:hypothetical protein